MRLCIKHMIIGGCIIMSQIVLNAREIYKEYSSWNYVVKALNNVSLSVKKGEFVGIMGKSGCGKTTLLNCLSTIDSVTSGEILVEGMDISKLNKSEQSLFRKKKLGYVFQEYNLLDCLTVKDNIALSLSLLTKNVNYISNMINSIAEYMDISNLLEKYPTELSGGQKQRVAIARALIKKPTLIFADEPTGALDTYSSEVIMKLFQKINKEENSTILMVTHDPFSASFCDRILFMRDGIIFHELVKNNVNNEEYYKEILHVLDGLREIT